MENAKPKTVVIGLGPTGLSCIRYLKSKDCPVAVTDSRENPPNLAELQKEFPDVPVSLGELSPSFIGAADQLVVSPGVSCHEPFIEEQMKKGVPVLGDIELFARENKKPVLAITGSNGKTTVTTLLGRMIEASGYKVSVCGNIGRQVLDALLVEQPDFYVLELSSFQLETTYSLKISAAVILNVTPDHMDRYDDFSDYLAAKQRIYQDCEHPVVNLDEPSIWETLPLVAARIGFTLGKPKRGQFGLREDLGQLYLAEGELLLTSVNNLTLRGQHHYQNALAALAMGFSVGLPMETMLSVLRTFKGISHRCEFVAEKRGVHWFNDSKGTNVGATIAAIQTLAAQQKGRLFLIAGGDAKKADLSGLQAPVENAVAQVILFGQDADAIAAVIDGVTPYEKVESLEGAVRRAAELAKPGDTVLLSPACASFDMFENYEHRGKTFIDLVKQLSS